MNRRQLLGTAAPYRSGSTHGAGFESCKTGAVRGKGRLQSRRHPFGTGNVYGDAVRHDR